MGGAFDFISVTPPYEKVSYEELMGLLDVSPLIHDNTLVVVEYARREKRYADGRPTSVNLCPAPQFLRHRFLPP